jgi:hypothetical protein
MNGKKLLLATLLLSGSVMALAQGLVGPPVDPRLCKDVNGCPSQTVTTGTQGTGAGSTVLNAIIIALSIVRL